MGKRQEPRENRQEVQDEITDELEELDVEVAAIRIQHGQEWLTVPEYISRKNGRLNWHEANLINQASYLDPSADYRVAFNNALGQRDPRFQQQPDQPAGGAAQQPPGTPPPPPGPPDTPPPPAQKVKSRAKITICSLSKSLRSMRLRSDQKEKRQKQQQQQQRTQQQQQSQGLPAVTGGPPPVPPFSGTPPQRPTPPPQMPPPPTKSSTKPKLQLPKWGGGPRVGQTVLAIGGATTATAGGTATATHDHVCSPNNLSCRA